MTPKALVPEALPSALFLTWGVFFSRSKRDDVSTVHPFCASLCADGEHGSFSLHLMTHKVVPLTGRPLP